MALDRRFYPWRELYESDAAMAIVDRLGRLIRGELERYADHNEAELRARLSIMNWTGSILGHRFCYDAYLGGLAHIQWSEVPGRDFFLMLPARASYPPQRPIDRIGFQTNGLVCTLAPENVCAVYLSSMENGSLLHASGIGQETIGENARLCAYCLWPEVDLQECVCGTVGYCSEICRQAHWREGHGVLCMWCASCIEFGADGEN